MSIYITEQKKEKLENEINELEDKIKRLIPNTKKPVVYFVFSTRLKVYKQILSEAIVLRVENDWKTVGDRTGSFWSDDAYGLEEEYPNGIIIKK